MGHEVTVCPDGLTAVAALDKNTYDLILVGKGTDEGQEPPISLERMLELTAAAEVDGQKFDANVTTYMTPEVLKQDTKSTIVCRVRPAQVEVKCGDQLLVNYWGDFGRLSADPVIHPVLPEKPQRCWRYW